MIGAETHKKHQVFLLRLDLVGDNLQIKRNKWSSRKFYGDFTPKKDDL